MSKVNENSLGKTVTARTAAIPSALVCTGKVISYCEAPTITIEMPDGTRVHWRADLCEEVKQEEISQ
jgi:hypothetical protein